MSSDQQIPPLVQEQLAKLQQTQQNLQSILAQKQQLEFDKLDTEKALEELKKANDDDMVFKHAGTILIKSNKKDLIEELDEKKELAKNSNKSLKDLIDTIQNMGPSIDETMFDMIEKKNILNVRVILTIYTNFVYGKYCCVSSKKEE